MSTVKPEGFHEHHRQKRRGGDNRPVNLLYVSPEMHDWIEKNPAKAMELGWTVSQQSDPAEIVVVLPDPAEFKKPRESKPRAEEKPRDRGVISMRPPKDERENGAGRWDDYMQSGRELGAKADFAWSESVPDYTVAMFFIGVGLLAFRDELDSGLEEGAYEAYRES